jgi:hypothetical protein
MDKNLSAAYRCPTPGGGTSNTGLIQVKPVNGSGDYLYELFKTTDMVTPIDTKTGGPNDGVFTSWASNTSYDTLLVRVTDQVCHRSFTEKIPIYDLNNAVVAWVEGSTRKCVGETLYLRALPLGDGTTFNWTIPGVAGGSTLQNPVIPNLTASNSGTCHLSISVAGCVGATVEVDIKVSVADKLLYWRPSAQDNNWHNSDNWLVKGGGSTYTVSSSVPAPCTTVHIAGNAQYYPSLDADGTPRNIGGDWVGLPACDTIIYHYGGETSYPHYLRYNRAKVQYNFRYYTPPTAPPLGTPGSQPTLNRDGNTTYPNSSGGQAVPYLSRARWYMVSSPLKYVTGGDFALGGKPMLYQRLYNASSPMTQYAYHDDFTRPFSNQAEKIETTGHALGLLAADNWPETGWKDHTNLQLLYGIIELPFYMENRPGIMDMHLQTYDGTTSAFRYFDWEDPALAPYNRYDYLDRDYRGYRFVFENARDTVTLAVDNAGATVAMYELPFGEILAGSTHNRIMIGNPLMCHIDFDKIYAYNSDVIDNAYWILVAEDEAFHIYDTGMGSSPTDGLTKDIAPLQGFVVQLKSTRPRNSLLLPLEGQYSVVSRHGWDYAGGTNKKPPLPKPKAAAAGENRTDRAGSSNQGRIDIYGITPMPAEVATSPSDSIRIPASYLFGREGTGNTPKIVFPEGLVNKAEVFAISADGEGINARQYESGQPQKLRFGIESQYEKEITLQFKLSGIVESAVLYDRVANRQIPVMDGSSYRFTHRFGRTEGSFRGMDSERFELSPAYRSGEGLANDSHYLSVSVNNRELGVLSSRTLETVELLDVQGNTLLKETVVSNGYRHELGVPSGVYLVRVKTSGGSTETRKVIIK